LKNSGLMQVYSQETGRLEALLLDEGILTELRTAAAGAVAVKYLGPSTVNRIGMVGTGIQARYQLRYLKQVTECRNVLLWGRTQEKAEALKEELLKEGWEVEVAHCANELLESCNIIVTTTCAREAILDGAVTGPLLIVCIGADSVGKQELSVELVSKADCLVCDSLLQTQERGEFQHAIREGKVELEKSVQEIGKVVAAGDASSGDSNLCIFDASGVAVQDCVVAQMVYESL
jgi:ornithine cyclodeaminase